jgi:hypothetical protein
MHLTKRTGPYVIIASKELSPSAAGAPRIRVTIVNNESRPIVLGDSRSERVLLNFVTPRARGTEFVHAVPTGRTESIPAGSSLTFHVTYPNRLGQPGVYRFNVSYGLVDSNILTYTVR